MYEAHAPIYVNIRTMRLNDNKTFQNLTCVHQSIYKCEWTWVSISLLPLVAVCTYIVSDILFIAFK